MKKEKKMVHLAKGKNRYYVGLLARPHICLVSRATLFCTRASLDSLFEGHHRRKQYIQLCGQ